MKMHFCDVKFNGRHARYCKFCKVQIVGQVPQDGNAYTDSTQIFESHAHRCTRYNKAVGLWVAEDKVLTRDPKEFDKLDAGTRNQYLSLADLEPGTLTESEVLRILLGYFRDHGHFVNVPILLTVLRSKGLLVQDPPKE